MSEGVSGHFNLIKFELLQLLFLLGWNLLLSCMSLLLWLVECLLSSMVVIRTYLLLCLVQNF